jgi:DNA-binding GntR family transcriptional regulator
MPPLSRALSEQTAYEALRHNITSGTFQPGEHLRSAEVAARLGVSRTPVREALRRLHAEGLVEVFAHRGAFVATVSPEDIAEVFELRVVLEAFAAETAAPRFTEAEIAALEATVARMQAAVAGPERDLRALTRANDEFHAAIIRTAANRRLGALMAGVVELSWVARTFSIYSDAELARSIGHHRQMIDAFRARDPVWAGAVMRAHIRSACHILRTSRLSADASGPDRPGETKTKSTKTRTP